MLSWIHHESRANARNRILLKSVPGEGTQNKRCDWIEGRFRDGFWQVKHEGKTRVQTARRLVYLEQKGPVKEKFR